jgi:transcriptional regulator with XRE-family HTH domain
MANKFLRTLRLFHQWTQAELAERVCDEVERSTGRRPAVDSLTISKLERGLISWPNRDSRQALRRILSVGSDTDLGFYSKRTAKDAEAFYRSTRQDKNPGRRREIRRGTAALSVETALYRPSGQSRPLSALRAELAQAQFEYRESRHAALGHRLPRLLDHVQASADPQVLTDAYNLTTEFLIKQNLDDLTLVTTERSREAALLSGSSLAVAEAERMVCIALRHAGRTRTAYALAVDAASQLADESALRTEDDLAQYGALLSTAAYTAAVAGDEDLANSYGQEADTIAARFEVDVPRALWSFGPAQTTLYRIGIASILGNIGGALRFAKRLRPEMLPTPERRARYWIDVARAHEQEDDRSRTRDALRRAYEEAPQEVTGRPAITLLARRAGFVATAG